MLSTCNDTIISPFSVRILVDFLEINISNLPEIYNSITS